MASQSRLSDLQRFYEILDNLEHKVGGTRKLSDCEKKTGWPDRGIYFFQEPSEERTQTGDGLRIVRVGSHALQAGQNSTLWSRLYAHKGSSRDSGGKHRGSVFRKHIGKSLICRDHLEYPHWGKGSSAPRLITRAERPLEQEVSKILGSMPFLWLAIEDEPGPKSMRAYIERNSIALLSNYFKPPLDPPSRDWLGRWCDRENIRKSGLWNSDHVEKHYNLEFLDILESSVNAMRAS